MEFRDEHFWTLSFGVLAGSLHVRIRRDADEQLVLSHVWNKLAGIVQILTIHIFKDDWMRRTTHQLVYNQQSINFQLAPPASMSQFTKPSAVPPQPQQKLQMPTTESVSSGQGQNMTASYLTSQTYSSQLNNKNLPASRKSPTLIDNDYVIVNP